MKKQFLIFAISVVLLGLISCRKEIQDEPVIERTSNSESVTLSEARGPVSELYVNLEGRFEFDKNLKDITGNLPQGMPTMRGATKYMEDRNGLANKALKLDGTYAVKLSNVPQQTNTAMSVWVYIPTLFSNLPRKSGWPVYGKGPIFYFEHLHNSWTGDDKYSFFGGMRLPPDYYHYNIFAQPTSFGWHHFVVSYDGNDINFFVDGKWIGAKNAPAQVPSSLQTYFLGFNPDDDYYNLGYWIGGMDDLRFYSRPLNIHDVIRLHDQ